MSDISFRKDKKSAKMQINNRKMYCHDKIQFSV